VNVVALLTPFNPERRLICKMPVGTVESIVDTLVPDPAVREYIQAFVNDTHVPREMWHAVRPNAGTTLCLKAMPQDPASIIGLVASLAGGSVAGSAFVIGALGTTGAAVAGAVVSFALLAAGQALFSPARVTRTEEDARFSITGARNRLEPYAPFPLVLGRHKMVPPYGGAPVTEIVGDDQYLRILLIWGYGPVNVTNIKIGNTALSRFEDVEVEHDFDGTKEALELYPSDAYQETPSVQLGTSYTARTTPRDTTDIGITVTFPNGLTRLNSNTGNPEGYIVVLQGQYRRTTESEWTDWFTEQVADDSRQTVRFAKRKANLPRGKYQIRLRRVDIDNDTFVPVDGFPAANADYYLPADEAEGRADISDTAVWSALRAFDGSTPPINLAGIAKTAIRMRATDQLNGVVDEVSGIVAKKLQVWDGSGWGGSEETSNPAAAFRYVMDGAANKRPTGRSGMNNPQLGEWYEFCEAEGFKYDAVHRTQRSVAAVAQDVAAAGRAAPARIDGKYQVIIQRPLDTVIQHITPRNSWNFKASMPFVAIPHGIKVRFYNENKGYIEDERIVYDDGFDETNATKFESIDLPGQTSPRNVYKLARAYLAAARLRPETFSVQMDIENIRVTRGDLCRLQNDVALIGQTSGRIKAIVGDTLTLDQEVTMEAGKDYRIRVRQSDGTTNPSNVTDVVGTYSSITVQSSSGMAVGDLFMFGERVPGGESMEVIVKEIIPAGDGSAELVMVPYNEAFYSAGDEIPPYEPVISEPVGASITGPPPPTITKILSDESALDPTAQGDIAPAILVYAEAGFTDTPRNGQAVIATHLQARWKRSDRPKNRFRYTEPVPAGAPLQLQPVRAKKSYRVEVRGIGSAGEVSEWTSADNITVLGISAPPPAVDNFRANTIGDMVQLEWDYTSIPSDVVGFEIRAHPKLGITEWQKMYTISDEVPRTSSSMAFPAREGSYAIKPFDALGNLSEGARYADATESDPVHRRNRTVQSFDEGPTFPGARFNCEVSGALLQLSDNSVRVDDDRARKLLGNGYYYFGEHDMGDVYTFRLLTDPRIDRVSDQNTMAQWGSLADVLTLGGEASYDAHRVHVEYSYSKDDSAARYDPESGAGAPAFTRARGEAISTEDVTKDEDFMFAMDVMFTDSPSGTLLHIGDTSSAVYLGVTNGLLVFRVGDTASNTSTTCAYATQLLSNYAGRHGRLYGRIDLSAGTVSLMFTDYATYDRVFTTNTNGGQAASAGFPSGEWVSAGSGSIGDDLGITLPSGEDGGVFNGEIAEARFYNATYEPTGVAGPASWSDWRRIPGRADVTARHIRSRVFLGTRSNGITPALTHLEQAIKTRPAVLEGVEAAPDPAAPVVIEFSPHFESLRGNPRIAAGNMEDGDYYQITGLSTSGFTITFYNSSGGVEARPFDWEQRGYGWKETA